MSNTFVLVKTPAAFDLPSALPSSLEAELYLYLAKERKAENADADSPQQRTSSIRTSLSLSSPELSPRSNSDLKLTDFKVVENHYWVNAMQVQHEVYSMLPVLHRESDVVPSENVISYLQDVCYVLSSHIITISPLYPSFCVYYLIISVYHSSHVIVTFITTHLYHLCSSDSLLYSLPHHPRAPISICSLYSGMSM